MKYKRKSLKNKALAAAILCTLLCGGVGSASAADLQFSDNVNIQKQYVYNASGNKLFNVTIYDSEGKGYVYGKDNAISDYKFTAEQLQGISDGLSFFSQIFGKATAPINVSVFANAHDAGEGASALAYGDIPFCTTIRYKNVYVPEYFPDVLQGKVTLPESAGIVVSVGYPHVFDLSLIHI